MIPYTYICYSHDDKEAVLPLVTTLQKNGVSLWYDDEIGSGSHWTEGIAERITKCRSMVFFVSKSSVNSHSCQKEIELAIIRKKPVVVVLLDDGIELPDHLSLMLSNNTVIRHGKNQAEKLCRLLADDNGSEAAACPSMPSASSAAPSWQSAPKGSGGALYSYVPSESVPKAPNPKKKSIFQRLFDKKDDLRIDKVKFSAVTPETAEKGRYLPITVVMYEDSMRSAVEKVIARLGSGAQETESGYHEVEKGSRVRMLITSEDVTVTHGEQEQIWSGGHLNFDFAIMIPSDTQKEQLLFVAEIYVNGFIATRLNMILDVNGRSGHNISVDRKNYSSAFVSYAHGDLKRVASIVQGMESARPDMDIFFDKSSLRRGQEWEPALMEEIDKRDILFLCWSSNAKSSPWVDKEWRYAYGKKGKEGIEPIPIESPDRCPPPEELGSKHFGDKLLYIIQSASSDSTPAEPEKSSYLVTSKGVAHINKDEFVIGRESNNDLILETATVSRIHAKILHNNDGYFIVDQSSSNHTFVNGIAIPDNTPIPLSHKSTIKIADEEMEFVQG